MADAPAFDRLSPPMTRCAPSFAHFAKGGNHQRMGQRSLPEKGCIGKIATHPPVWGTMSVNDAWSQEFAASYA